MDEKLQQLLDHLDEYTRIMNLKKEKINLEKINKYSHIKYIEYKTKDLYNYYTYFLDYSLIILYYKLNNTDFTKLKIHSRVRPKNKKSFSKEDEINCKKDKENIDVYYIDTNEEVQHKRSEYDPELERRYGKTCWVQKDDLFGLPPDILIHIIYDPNTGKIIASIKIKWKKNLKILKEIFICHHSIKFENGKSPYSATYKHIKNKLGNDCEIKLYP